jgi:hypothetical protein
MASWREIERVRKDPRAFRGVAKSLLNLPRADFTDWEVDFLEGMLRQVDEQGLTTRQSEKLLQIRDDSEFITEFRGFSVRLLLRQCYDARLDLSEEDEEWITRLFERNQASLRRRHIGHLIRCAHELYIVDEDVGA